MQGKRKQKSVNCLMMMLLFVLSFTLTLVSPTLGSTNLTSSGNVKVLSDVTYIPSELTDFPNNDSSLLHVRPYKPVQDAEGMYHLRGEVTNISNQTLIKTKVSAILFDDKEMIIGSAKPWYVGGGLNMKPLNEGSFDLVIHPDDLSGKINSYKLLFSYSVR